MSDLLEVIEDSISDSTLPEQAPEAPDTLEATPTPTDTTEVAPEPAEAPTEAPTEPVETSSVPSPAAKLVTPVQEDEFSKKFGIPAESHPGRENRIPYSRVKKIAEKAAAEKAKEVESTFTPRITKYEADLKERDARLTQVAEFEDIMMNQPDRFLQMLSTVPAYALVFQALEAAMGQPQTQSGSQPAPVTPPVPGEAMPEPDQTLEDGTQVYSMEGLKALLAWQAGQVETRVTKQVEDRYKPMESAWQSDQYMRKVMPQIQSQIEEARKWPLFTDNEADITKALQQDQRLSLEGAYQRVVWPKLVADRNKIREEVMAEIKKAPISTAAPARAARPVSTASNEPRSLEDIIRDAAGIQAPRNL